MADFTKNNTTTRTRELMDAIHGKYTNVVVEVSGDYIAGYKIRLLVNDTEKAIECGTYRASVNAALLAILTFGVSGNEKVEAKAADYVAPAPFRSTKEQVDFLQAELDHQVDLVQEFREKWEGAEAKLANVRKIVVK